jgi:hypothetical protein
MQFHISTEKDIVTVHAEVVKIEVEDMLTPDEGSELYFRTIRFVTSGGEAITVLCKAYNATELRLHRVKALKPVKKPKWKLGSNRKSTPVISVKTRSRRASKLFCPETVLACPEVLLRARSSLGSLVLMASCRAPHVSFDRLSTSCF